MKNDKNRECTWIFILGLIIAISIVITSFFSSYESVTLSDKDMIDFNNGWTINGEEITLPYMSNTKKDQSVTIENTLPKQYPDQSNLFFLSSNNDIEVFIENNSEYTFGADNYYQFSDDPGTSYQLINLQKQFEGKNITIVITPKANLNSGYIPSMYIATSGSVFNHIFVSKAFVVIASAFIIIISLYFIFQSLFLAKKAKNIRGLLYLGFSGVIFSIFTSIDSLIWQFFQGNSLVMHYITYYCLMLLPITLILCVKNLFNVFNIKIFDILIIVSLINIILCSLLEISNTLGLADSSIITHIINILSIFSVYFMFIKFRHDFNSTLKHGLLFFTTTILIDIVRRIIDSENKSFFSIFGIIIFLIFVGKKTLDNLAMEISDGKKYKDIAYNDTLTGALTLMALNENIHKLDKSAEYGVAIFDLNTLKYYNDKFGHSVGDYMLTTAVRILKQSFEKYKYIYRIGGDEFLIVMPNATLSEFENSINKLLFLQNQASSLRFVNGESIIIEFAYGFAICENESFDSVREKADMNMYSKKKELKT